MKKVLIIASVATSFMFAADAAQLVKDNCTSCHMTVKPTQEQKASMKAPPMPGVMFHLKDVLKDEQKVKEFIVDYVQYPTKEKAICMPRKIERFGLMPSMKGVLTEKELSAIATYLYDNFPPADFIHEKMNKDKTCTTKKKPNRPFSPFLITGKMPHLTKMVKQNWDNPLFALTDAQKEKLLAVRKTTMGSVTKLKKEILQLEKEVSKETMSGVAPIKLKAKVDQIANLKAQATMTHIKCIHDTKNILDSKQLGYLLQ